MKGFFGLVLDYRLLPVLRFSVFIGKCSLLESKTRKSRKKWRGKDSINKKLEVISIMFGTALLMHLITSSYLKNSTIGLASVAIDSVTGLSSQIPWKIACFVF